MWNWSRFTEALSYATELHQEQIRKGTDIPYISHLLAVASLVLENGGKEDEAIAALLHDAIEDQGGDATRQEIRKRFGEQVASIVDGCTDAEVTPKPPWRKRKEAYVAHLREAPPSVRLVSAADKLHNLRSILMDFRKEGEKLWDRFNASKEESLWYYGEIVSILKAQGPEHLADELERTLEILKEIASSEE